jgi:hypothetical protein
MRGAARRAPAHSREAGFEAMMDGKDSVIAASGRSKMTGLANEISLRP